MLLCVCSHRYEVNPEYVAALQAAGLHFVGTDDRQVRMEIVELDREAHPFFFAAQYHPEFQSHPHRPSPPFHGFILAASGQLDGALPMPATLRRRTPSTSSSAGSTPGSPSRPYAAKPPLAPGAASDGLGPSAAAATAGGGSGAASSGNSPARPVRQVSLSNLPPSTTVGAIAPAEGSRGAGGAGGAGGVTVPEGTFRASAC